MARRLFGDVKVEPADNGLLVSPARAGQDNLTFRLQDVPVAGKELSVFACISTLPRRDYPEEMPRFAMVAVEGGCINLMDGDADEVSCGECLRGGSEKEIDAAGGGRVRLSRAEKIGGETMMAYAVHPPYINGKGYVFWTSEVGLPARDFDLRFSLGMSDKAPARSDGVWFSVLVAQAQDGKPPLFKKIFEQSTKSHEWIPCSVSLSEWAGKKVIIKFVSDCGPRDNATTDQGFWGNVRLVRSGIRDSEITPAKSFMTWLGRQPFSASFYFRDVRSEKVDLVFSVEGDAPVLIKGLTAHAAPDARCRLFENGIVLGNPSHEPVTFDLKRSAPGMKLRRIRATELQDAEVNSGAAVGESVTLGPLDGLFLVRE